MPGPRGAPPALSGHRGRTHAVHSKCGSVLSPPAAALPLPVRQPPPNRTDAASGALRVFSGTHSARSRRRPEWKQRGNSAASPGAGRAPDRNRQDSAPPNTNAIFLYVPPRFRKRNRSVLPKRLSAGSFHSGQREKLFLITDLH